MKTAKEMLAEIDDFLSSEEVSEAEQLRLWWVLSALRGPDFDSLGKTKEKTTSYIRGNALPKTAKSRLAIPLLFKGSSPFDTRPRENLEVDQSHFLGHILAAKESLKEMDLWKETE